MITKNLESPAEEKGSGKYGLCSRYWCRLNTGIFRAPGFFSRLGFTCSTAGLFLLTCAMLLLAGGCGTEEGMPHFMEDLPPGGTAPPTRANPISLEFRETHLESPNSSDGEDYKDDEFMAHYGLGVISADEAYRRGYFGEGAIIAVADDGMDPSHPDLAVSGKITKPWHVRNRNALVKEPDTAGAGHGTYVALIAAGAMDNTGGIFEITVAGGASIPTKNIHGVAPRASVMPISMEGGGNPMDAIRYAAENEAHVLNLSIGVSNFYYGKYTGREGVWLTVPLPYFRPLLERGLSPFASSLKRDFTEVARVLENEDIVLVWAAGNEGWNSLNNTVNMCGKEYIGQDECPLSRRIDGGRDSRVTAQEFMENFMWIYDESDPDSTISFKDMWGDGCGEDNCIEYNSSGEWREAPSFEPGLLGKWIVVAASDESGTISSFSNGCGAARNWCLAAPGENLTLNAGNSRGLDGTSFAAPMVSGALAVLKSRFPDMPMEVIQAILLVSAEPVGIRKENPEEPDPVYGWGRLNLGNAVTLQDAVRLPYSVPGTGGATQAISSGYYNPPRFSASIQTYAGNQYRSLGQGQCVSPYEVIRRYQNRNGRPKQMINRSGV